MITTENGAPFYGHVATALTEAPAQTGPDQFLNLANFPKNVPIHYSRRFRLDPIVAAQIRHNHDAVVVIHGIDYNHNGQYDDVLSRDNKEHRHLPIEETAPALCGPLKTQEPESGQQAASGTQVYTATLAATDSAPSSAPLLCDLHSVAARLL